MSDRKVLENGFEVTEKAETVFSLAETLDGDTLTVAVSGSIPNEYTYEFDDEITAIISVCMNVSGQSGAKRRLPFQRLKIDLSGVNHLGASILRLFLKYQHMAEDTGNVELVFFNPCGEIRKRFEEIGYMELLNVRLCAPEVDRP